jgi:hypothetical protein
MSRRAGRAVNRGDGRPLLLDACRSSPAAAGETTGRSRMEQSVDVGGGLALLVLSISDSHAGGDFRSSLAERKWSAIAGAFLSCQ